MSTRRTPQHQHFDHGAQYFTVRDETFDCFVRTWLRDGVVALWNGRVVELLRGEVKSKEDTTVRFVGVPGMNAICRHLATDFDVRLQTRVVPPVREAGRWRLHDQEGTELGAFDCVISSAPTAQTSELLSEAPELRQTAERVVMHGCWAAILLFDRSLNLPLEGVRSSVAPLLDCLQL